MKTLLLVNASQRYKGVSEGELTKYYLKLVENIFLESGWKVIKSEIENYDIQSEVDKHQQADFIFTQMPVYWFGAPWLYKKYLDEVFNQGLSTKKLLINDGRSRHDKSMQYGTGGLMQGTDFMMSMSFNAPQNAFNDLNQYQFKGKSINSISFPIESIYKFSGFNIKEPFASYDVVKNLDLKKDSQRLEKIIKEYIKSINI